MGYIMWLVLHTSEWFAIAFIRFEKFLIFHPTLQISCTFCVRMNIVKGINKLRHRNELDQ